MTNRLALIVAVVLGILSVVGITVYVDNIETRQRQSQELIDVLVASQDVPAGVEFTNDFITTAQHPGRVIESTFQDSYVKDRQTVLGLRTSTPIKAGQVLQHLHFATGAKDILTFGEEYRALTIPVGSVEGVSGMLRPLDYVDVIISMELTRADRPGKSVELTRTLFKKVLILATSRITDKFDPRAGNGNYSDVTFRLTPLQCNKLVFATARHGGVHLALVRESTNENTYGFTPVTADHFYWEIDAELRQTLSDVSGVRVDPWGDGR